MRIEISAIQIAMTYDAMNLPDRLNYVPVATTATAAAPSMSTTQGDFAVRVTEGQCCSGFQGFSFAGRKPAWTCP